MPSTSWLISVDECSWWLPGEHMFDSSNPYLLWLFCLLIDPPDRRRSLWRWFEFKLICEISMERVQRCKAELFGCYVSFCLLLLHFHFGLFQILMKHCMLTPVLTSQQFVFLSNFHSLSSGFKLDRCLLPSFVWESVEGHQISHISLSLSNSHPHASKWVRICHSISFAISLTYVTYLRSFSLIWTIQIWVHSWHSS